MPTRKPHEQTLKLRAISELPGASTSQASRAPGSMPDAALASELVSGPAGGQRAALAATRRRLWVPLGAGLAALAVVIGVLLWLNGDHATEPIVAEPPPSAQAPSERPAPAAELRNGAHRIALGVPEIFRIGDSELTLAAASELRVSGDDTQGWFLALDAGRIDCSVTPRPDRPPFVVIAGETRISVIGARFSVTQGPDGTQVAVEEGRVRVEAHAQTTELVAGESWSATEPPSQKQLDAPARAPESPRKAPLSRAARAADERMQQAARLESSRPAAAVRIYRGLRKKRGPWVADALYAEARLELARGRNKSAKPLLVRYLKAYPEGANAAEARSQLERLRARR